MIRRIIQIDEEICNGCGLCAQACHEGAIGMVDGKAKLLREECAPGTKVILDEAVNTPYYDAPAGLAGIVQSVDDAGQILCRWENGLSFRLVPGTDHFHKEAAQELEWPDEKESDLEL